MMSAHEFFDKRLAPALDTLAGRWQDESKYEDWNDYVAAMRKVFVSHPQFTFQSLTARPFAVKFSHDGKIWMAICSAKNIHLLETL